MEVESSRKDDNTSKADRIKMEIGMREREREDGSKLKTLGRHTQCDDQFHPFKTETEIVVKMYVPSGHTFCY